MPKLKIGYLPISNSLSSAGDRRRLVFWANNRGHEIVTSIDKSVDVIVASVNADLNYDKYADLSKPLVFDLVDAYFSPSSYINDLARGLIKKITNQMSGKLQPFSKSVLEFAKFSDAVICSSIEQQEYIKELNAHTYIILDSHEEFPFLNPNKNDNKKSKNLKLMWEGQPATIGGFKYISSELRRLSKKIDLEINLVTDENYFKLLNKYFEGETMKLINRELLIKSIKTQIIPWSTQKLVETASESNFGVIPVDISHPMQRLKPENRLLIMWRLGLPVITSETPAYLRVENEIGVKVTCKTNQEWTNNLLDFYQNPWLAEKQVTLGQDYVRTMHNRSILLEKWDKVFNTVMDKP